MESQLWSRKLNESKIENSQLDWITRNSEKFGFEYVPSESGESVITLKPIKNYQERKPK